MHTPPLHTPKKETAMRVKISAVYNYIEKFSIYICLAFLVLGFCATEAWPVCGTAVSKGIEFLLNAYSYIVPFLLYLLVAPALFKVLGLKEKYGNGWVLSVFAQFVVTRVLAILFSAVALALIFRLPIATHSASGWQGALKDSFLLLGRALVFSPFLWGIYAAVITVFVFSKSGKVKNIFSKVGAGIENIGQGFVVLAPFFMLALGAFLSHLPAYIERGLSGSSLNFDAPSFNFNILGLQHIPGKYKFVGLYLAIGLLTGLLCIIWHILYLAATKIIQPKFRLRSYIKNYWVRIYPLLWASSSESLAVPLNLNLMKRTFPYVPAEIRQFVISGGSYLGINGTVISVYVMGAVLAKVLNVPISFSQLALSLPAIFVLGYAVPGIPGELIIFAGAMGQLLGVPPQTLPFFLALYLTMQIGLPDSFRTGCNSTDCALVSIMSSVKVSLHKRWTVKKRIGFSYRFFVARNTRFAYRFLTRQFLEAKSPLG